MAATTVAAMAAGTAATTRPRKRGRPKGSKDKQLKKRRQNATGGGDTMAGWQLRRHLCLLYIASEALESLKYIGFDEHH